MTSVRRLDDDVTMRVWTCHYRGDKVIAVASLNYDPIVAKTAEKFLSGKAPTKADVQ